MELTNILGAKASHDAEPSQFLALELTDDIVQAAVWKVDGGITEVVSVGTPIPWNGDQGSEDELLKAADSTISVAVDGLTKEPNSAIFGVPSAWLDNGNLLPDKKNYIKQICTSLELKPLGFVVIIDSVIRYLRMQEGTPSTAILVEIADTELTIATVTLGKLQHQYTITRGDDVAYDVETALTHCISGITTLPSRFVVFNGMYDLEEIVQNLTLVDWISKFPFLHIPKVEALEKEVVIKALCVAGGSEVARSIGYEIKPLDEAVEAVAPSNKDSSHSVVADLGFHTTDEVEDTPSQPEEEIDEDRESRNSHFSLPHFSLPTLKNISLPKLNFLPFTLPKWAIIGSGLALISIVGILSAVWLFPKATVTIFVTPNNEEALFDLKLSSDQAEPEFATLTIPAETKTIEVSAKSEVPATGTKLVGEPSRGEVTLYNRTNLKKTFSKGTVISSGNLKFTLDADVSVASKSAGADYVDVPGKATVSVTAQAIGDLSNLKSGTEFVVGTYTKDSYIGKNDAPFKGGSSEEVLAIDAKDKSELVKVIKEKMIEDAQTKQDSSGVYVHVIPSSLKIVKETYSGKVGAEAKSLEGEILGEVDIYLIKQDLVIDFATRILSERLNGSYTMLSSPTIELTQKDDAVVNVKTTVTTLPVIQEDAIKKQIKGLGNSNLIEQAISTISGYSGVKVSISPTWIPPKLKSLPKNTDNIIIKLQPVD